LTIEIEDSKMAFMRLPKKQSYKVTKMKKILLTILPLLLIVGCELKNGIYNDFYPNGQKRFEMNFSNGVEGNYKDGHEDGNWVYYDSTGKKNLELNFKNKKLHGSWIQWYENEQKRFERSYKNGKKDGKWTWYNKDGSVKEVVEYPTQRI